MNAELDILIPTYRRPAGLAVTLTSLIGQTLPRRSGTQPAPFRVVVSDQTEDGPDYCAPEVLAAVRVLRATGREVELHRHLPRRGVAEHRQFLLDQARGRYALFLDDDVILEPDLLARLVTALEGEGCGFVGSALIGLSYEGDERHDDEPLELWEAPVEPEDVEPGSPAWNRHRLHSAANLLHVQRRLGIERDRQRLYKVAWIGGCVLYDVEKLRACGGFTFWTELPVDSAGEDALAQRRVMARYGGAAIIPSGAYHLEAETTIERRDVDAPWVLS